MPQQVPVVEGLFAESKDGPRLLGSRCEKCGTHYFPRASRCSNPGCRSAVVVDAALGPHGTLYSYTVQHYAPPPPFRFDEPFVPYAIGLVELPVGLRVVGILKLEDLGRLRLGLPLVLVVDRLATDEEGRDVMTWKFKEAGR